jgi:hypothetical protein
VTGGIVSTTNRELDTDAARSVVDELTGDAI